MPLLPRWFSGKPEGVGSWRVRNQSAAQSIKPFSRSSVFTRQKRGNLAEIIYRGPLSTSAYEYSHCASGKRADRNAAYVRCLGHAERADVGIRTFGAQGTQCLESGLDATTVSAQVTFWHAMLGLTLGYCLGDLELSRFVPGTEAPVIASDHKRSACVGVDSSACLVVQIQGSMLRQSTFAMVWAAERTGST
ncbi:hypothetical protein LY76DRAFT_188418 [Colletotrichum caudatum]|nr:hypothetical protein LY76DRAFT_188418 [Colletotrichum caudatum]